MRTNMRILVDMDNTILDMIGRVSELWIERYGLEPPTTMTKSRFDQNYEALYPGAGRKVRDM